MIYFAVFLVAAYGLVLTSLYVFQRSLLFHPNQTVINLSALQSPAVKEVSLTTADGVRLVAWYKSAPKQGGTVLYFHGNAGTIEDRKDKIALFEQENLGYLFVEYRGYGGNPGRPSEEGFYLDGEAGIAFLKSQGTDLSAVVLYGESIGSGVATEMALRYRVKGLILEAPFTNIAEVSFHHYPIAPTRFLIRDHFDNLSKIKNINTSLLIVHGDADKTVPYRFGVKLYNAALTPKQFLSVPHAGHSDLLTPLVKKHLIEFIK